MKNVAKLSIKYFVFAAFTVISFLLPARAESLAGEAASAGVFEGRRDLILQRLIRSPAPNPTCPEVGRESPCIWGKLSLGLALLATSDPSSKAAIMDANKLISDATSRELSRSAPDDDEDIEGRGGGKNLEQRFHFATALLFDRVISQFGPLEQGGNGYLDSTVGRNIANLFGAWAKKACSLRDADPSLVWRPWGSENHDIMRAYTCWSSARILKKWNMSSEFVYYDGSGVGDQLKAWEKFLNEYIRNRSLNGLFVEVFSPTYAKYSLSVFYNIYDFSDQDELKGRSGSLITLWWSLWGQEQVEGSHGGSKARRYFDKLDRLTPDGEMSWVYGGQTTFSSGAPHPVFMNFLLSSYRLPRIVQNIMRRIGFNDSYEVWTRNLGLSSSPKRGLRFDLSDKLDIVRYSYVGPGFVMGSALSPPLSAAEWTNISSQNRWMGVVLEGPDKPAVYARPNPRGMHSNYNALIGVQHKGLQIVQATVPPVGRGVGDMVIHVNRSLQRVERGGWIFVDGSAFVAAKPVRGGTVATKGGEEFRLTNAQSPVIIQVSSRASFPSFSAFQDAVLEKPIADIAGAVTFQGVSGEGPLTFFDQGKSLSLFNGQPVSPPEGWTLYSPFVRQKAGSDQVELQFKDEHLILKF